jgi:Tfp pilus assembly protein PilE
MLTFRPDDRVLVLCPRGFTVLEAMLASSIVVIVAGISVPATTSALDDVRTGMAAP